MDAFRGSRILIAGGTGLVGARLTGALLQQGAEVLILSRNPDDAHLPQGAQAHGWQALPGILEGCCAVINLTGEGIADHRWTPARKKALESSRMGPTRSLLSALEKARERPSVLINASAIGIYGTRAPEPTQEPIDEAEALGKGFLPELCRAWEAAADPAQALGVRVVKLRTGVVLAREGGALPKLLLPVRCFAGTPFGSGRQGFSWIHIEDLIRLILECIRNPAFEGPINATAPHPCSQAAFTRLLAERLHRPLWPLPACLTRNTLRLLVGEMAESMLLGGAFVLPGKALDLGFSFRFSEPAEALEDLV